MTELKRLIHNNMTVSEQFKLMNKFAEVTDQAWRVNAKHGEYEKIDLKRNFVEERFGIRCKVLYTDNSYNPQGRLVEPRIVDEKKCLFYILSQ